MTASPEVTDTTVLGLRDEPSLWCLWCLDALNNGSHAYRPEAPDFAVLDLRTP